VHTYLIEMLECPVCHGMLKWDVIEEREDRLEAGTANCQECSAAYPVREGIGIFLTPDLPRKDLWEQVDSQLMLHLRERPDLERKLMDVSINTLGPADLFYRALVLDERGKYEKARELEELSEEGIYTEEYRACWQSQIEYVIEEVAGLEGPIIDLASGRGYLVDKMAQRLDRLIVATDFSPRVLRRDRMWLEAMGLYDKVSLLAFDARRTPFREKAIGVLTTNLGLPNIEEPGKLLRELRRVVGGRFLAITHFYPEEDEINVSALRENGLITLFRAEAVESFSSAGWDIEVANVCRGQARPTPTSEVLEGAGIDGFPLAETMLEWCVIAAH
jgi:uncharacterized protein YbaR (Trm112 family)/SAM-dependent methyltransferase